MKKTIYDIAKELGIAPSTVSKALNGSDGVSEKMRKKVVNYTQKVRYFPNSNASKLKTKKSYVIGIVYSETSNHGLEHSFFSSILQAFKNYVESEGYEITFVISNYAKQQMTYLEFCNLKNINGVFIVACVPSDQYVNELIESDEIHCVSTDYYADKLYTVVSDNRKGSRYAVRYLFGKGFKRIAMITGPNDSYASNERKEGFYYEMEKQRLTVEEEFVIEAYNYTFEDGYGAGLTFLAKTDYPKAIYIVSDDIAMGFIKCLKDHGVRTPEDVSVIGFDDIPYAKYYQPSLTTLRQNTKELGDTAAKKLLDLINGETDEKTGVTKIPVELIKRDSTI